MQASTLVLAEHKNGKLAPTTLNAVQAAKAFNNPITLLVSGFKVAQVVEDATRVEGVQNLLVADDAVLDHTPPEAMAALLAAVDKRRDFDHVMAPASTFGKNILPRAAALQDAQAVADVTEIKDARTFVRPVYAGNALATVKNTSDTTCFLTVCSSMRLLSEIVRCA
jgi:electron transfer flavoprotein alpha subunit